MREYIIIVAVFAGLLLGVPPIYGRVFGEGGDSSAADSHLSADYDFPQQISMLLTESGEVVQIGIEDYLIGCLFAQIPATYHQQALNAQAVAAHSYLLRMLEDGVVISDDAASCQPFFTAQIARQRYGDDYDNYLEIFRAAARHGANRALFFEGAPIYAVYHGISAGVTNTAFSVWGQDFPYLQSVESSWDREHPNFIVHNEMTSESIRLAIFDYNRTASMPIDYSQWFVDIFKNEYGYVLSVKAGETTLSGGDMWRIFNLRSTAFETSFRSGGVFVFETRGFGHGVGLSQYGADVLGRRGFSSDDILKHYYTNIEIVMV
ncbi:MAG: SpoIID/LytB domain-containing protein [Oscillospiraceae bacterium]|nr:SpoIID/LytB domain-containing protein [Oscillospiraceae bacterium]